MNYAPLSGDAQPLEPEVGDRRYLVHPSRSAPLCSACQHFESPQWCNHPAQPINPASGCANAPIHAVRGDGHHKAVCKQRGWSYCGVAGFMFQPLRTASGAK